MMNTRDKFDHCCIGKCFIGRVFTNLNFKWLAWQKVTTVSIRVVTTCTVIAFCLAEPSSAENQQKSRGLVVEKFAWTNAVKSNREFDIKYEHRVPNGPIVLWTKVRATKEALNSLREKGRLPIWHKWFVECGSTYEWVKTHRPIDAIDLGSGPREPILQKLQTEVDERGHFDWRTWSRKRNVSNCFYTVKVVDNKNTPLYCEEIKDKCELRIKLGD